MKMQGVTALLLLAAMGSAFAQFEGLITGNGELTAAQKKLIVDNHNKHRRMAGASDMLLMEYNDVLQEYALKAANKCTFNHTLNTQEQRPKELGGPGEWIGESIYVDNGFSFEVTEAENSWWSEIDDYTYDTMTCAPGRMCGHYTQVVWAGSSKVGCAVRKCDAITSWDDRKGFILFCQYAVGGNVDDEHPFTKGDSCSACPTSAPFCDNGLCSATEPSVTIPGATAAPAITVYTADTVCQKKLGMEPGHAFFCAANKKYNDSEDFPTQRPTGDAMCQPKSLKCSKSYTSDFCCNEDPVDGMICDVGKVCQGTECVDYPTAETNDRKAGCIYGDQANFIVNGIPQDCATYFAPNASNGFIDNLQQCIDPYISRYCCAYCETIRRTDYPECPWGSKNPASCEKLADDYFEDKDPNDATYDPETDYDYGADWYMRNYMCEDPVLKQECCGYECERADMTQPPMYGSYTWNIKDLRKNYLKLT